MKERDTPPGRGHAPLRPGRWGDRIRVTRHGAGELAPWVDYLWVVRWDLDAPHEQDVIPQPVVHAAAETQPTREHAGGGARPSEREDRRVLVHGVGRATFHRTLSGTGHVVGAAFRAGGFRAFVDGPVSALAHRVVPAGDLMGVDDRPLAADLLDPEASDGDVAALVSRLHHRNRGVIGPDAGLLRPGERLAVPPLPQRQSADHLHRQLEETP